MPTRVTPQTQALHIVGLEEIWPQYNVKLTDWWNQMALKVMSDSQLFLKFLQEGDFVIPPVVPEGKRIPDDNPQFPFPFQVQPVKVALGFRCSRLAWESDQYGKIKGSIRKLKLAFNKAREKFAADRFNNATSTSATYKNPDGLPLASAAHLLQTGTASNIITGDPPFGPGALETMVEAQKMTVSHRGDPDPQVGPFDLLIHPNQEIFAERVVFSQGQSSTANRDDNMVGSRIRRIISNPYFTNTLAYATRTADSDSQPFCLLNQSGLRMTLEEDKGLDEMVYRFLESYIFFERGWRGLQYSDGSGV